MGDLGPYVPLGNSPETLVHEFKLNRTQQATNMARRVARRAFGIKSNRCLRLSTHQEDNLKTVYNHLPTELKELIHWCTVVDEDGLIAGFERIQEVVIVCIFFRCHKLEEKEAIECFVYMLDVMLDTQRDAVIDELILLYPALSLEIRNRVELYEGVVEGVQRLGGVDEVTCYFREIEEKKELELHGFDDDDVTKLDALVVLHQFISLLEKYAETGYGHNRMPRTMPREYIYRCLVPF
jgi:hypothetical protein